MTFIETTTSPLTGSTPITPLAQPFTLAGNKTGVVIIHGYGGSIGDYRVLADHLHDAGLTVVGVRLAGHGQGQVALRRSSIIAYQQSVAEAISDVQKTCRHVFILGSSFGGVLALDYAQHHPDISGLILVNTALSYSGAGVFQGLILRLLRLFTPDYRKPGLSTAEQEQAKAVGSSPAWPINGILSTAAFARRQVIPNLPSIHVPALIIHSQSDPVVGVGNSKKLAALLGSTVKPIVELPLQTHRPFRHPEANRFIAEQTRDFIQSVIAKKE